MRKCPVPPCIRDRGSNAILCAQHWYRAPKTVRAQLWRLYRRQPGGTAHRRAVRDVLNRAKEMTP